MAATCTSAPRRSTNPSSSNLNFPLGDDRANAVTVGLARDSNLSITFVAPLLGPTAQVIFDVTGYFTPDATGATYIALTPTRILDSRDGTGGLAALQLARARTFTVIGASASNAVAVTGNLTVTGQTSAGYLYIGPAPVDQPDQLQPQLPAR